MRARRLALAIFLRPGGPFMRCVGSSCGAALVGVRCWQWTGHDGVRHAACVVCFPGMELRQ